MVTELFTRKQEEVLDIVTKYPGASVSKLAKILGVPSGTGLDRINRLEAGHWLKSSKRETVGQERRVWLLEDFPAEEAECVPVLGVKAKLMKKFSLDLLDFDILEQVKGNEPFRELAERFKEVENQMRARLERSIPAKFEVGTFQEAKALFIKLKKEAEAPLVV